MARKKEPEIVRSVFKKGMTLLTLEERLDEVLMRASDSEIYQDYMFTFMHDFMFLISDLNQFVTLGNEVHCDKNGKMRNISQICRWVTRLNHEYYKGYLGDTNGQS